MHVNGSRNGTAAATDASRSEERCPRRLVLLADNENSAAEVVLAEYRGSEISGKRLHADLQRWAAKHPGRIVAAEWAGPLGWTRFLWCTTASGGS
jgi:hypothetical protein